MVEAFARTVREGIDPYWAGPQASFWMAEASRANTVDGVSHGFALQDECELCSESPRLTSMTYLAAPADGAPSAIQTLP